jgi:hypothetical protein
MKKIVTLHLTNTKTVLTSKYMRITHHYALRNGEFQKSVILENNFFKF